MISSRCPRIKEFKKIAASSIDNPVKPAIDSSSKPSAAKRRRESLGASVNLYRLGKAPNACTARAGLLPTPSQFVLTCALKSQPRLQKEPSNSFGDHSGFYTEHSPLLQSHKSTHRVVLWSKSSKVLRDRNQAPFPSPQQV